MGPPAALLVLGRRIYRHLVGDGAGRALGAVLQGGKAEEGSKAFGGPGGH